MSWPVRLVEAAGGIRQFMLLARHRTRLELPDDTKFLVASVAVDRDQRHQMLGLGKKWAARLVRRYGRTFDRRSDPVSISDHHQLTLDRYPRSWPHRWASIPPHPDDPSEHSDCS